MTAPDLGPANYPAEPDPPDLDSLPPRARGAALLSTAGRAMARRNLCDWCNERATVLLDGDGWTDRACQVHAVKWGDGRNQRPIGDAS